MGQKLILVLYSFIARAHPTASVTNNKHHLLCMCRMLSLLFSLDSTSATQHLMFKELLHRIAFTDKGTPYIRMLDCLSDGSCRRVSGSATRHMYSSGRILVVRTEWQKEQKLLLTRLQSLPPPNAGREQVRRVSSRRCGIANG